MFLHKCCSHHTQALLSYTPLQYASHFLPIHIPSTVHTRSDEEAIDNLPTIRKFAWINNATVSSEMLFLLHTGTNVICSQPFFTHTCTQHHSCQKRWRSKLIIFVFGESEHKSIMQSFVKLAVSILQYKNHFLTSMHTHIAPFMPGEMKKQFDNSMDQQCKHLFTLPMFPQLHWIWSHVNS